MSIIELKNIKKEFQIDKDKNFLALKDVSLHFPNSGIVSITGESGCGKSTLLNILGMLDEEYSGTYYFSGVDVKTWNKKKKRNFILRNIGIVFQHYHLLEEHTVLYNIMLPNLMLGEKKKTAKQKAIQLLDSISFPKELYLSKTKDLSGGEKQRIAILRSLINDPNIILADEPTGALDSENAQSIMNIFKKESENKLVIIVSHNSQLVEEYSDYVITLHDGEIINQKELNKTKSTNIVINNKRKTSDEWTNKVSGHNFLRRIKRNFISILTASFSLIASFVVMVFISEIPNIAKNENAKHIDYGVATISKEIKSNINNGLVTLVNSSRPNEREIKQLSNQYKNYTFELNYDTLVPSYPEVISEGIILKEVAYKPIYSFKGNYINKDLLIYGNMPTNDSLYDVVINKALYHQIKKFFFSIQFYFNK